MCFLYQRKLRYNYCRVLVKDIIWFKRDPHGWKVHSSLGNKIRMCILWLPPRRPPLPTTWLGDKIETMEAGCAVKTALICLSHSDHLIFNSVHKLWALS